MKDSLNQLMERLLSGTELTREEILWGALVIALGLAVIQLLIMLGTRWGSRNLSSKALLLSLLIHLSSGLCVVATHPGFEGLPLVDPTQPPAPEVKLEDLAVMDDVPRASTQSGNAPFWKKLPEFKPAEMARVDRPLPEFRPLEFQERQRPNEVVPAPPLRRMEQLPFEARVEPEPIFQGDPMPVTSSPDARPLESTQPQGQEAPARTTERQRFAMTQNRTPFDTDLDREPQRGNFDEVKPQSRPDQRLAAMELPNSENPDAFLRRDDDLAALQPRTGPELNALPDPLPGLEATPTEPVAETGNEPPSRFNRVARRPSSPDGVPGLPPGLERNRTSELPESEGQLAMTTPGLPELEPLAPSPELARTEESSGFGPSDNVPQLYQLRDAEIRKQVTAQNGGTAESEKAVEDSLKWLASAQEPTGFWDASRWGSGQVEFDAEGVNRQFAGRNADTGLTGLTVLAFLGAGYTHEKGPYQQQVQKALLWLIAQQNEEGSLAGNAEHYAKMYCHGMATYALAEAYGMSRVESREWLRPALEKAVKYIVDFQHPTDGGWRYEKGKMGDMSMFGWQLMALKSAEINGVPVPQSTRTLMQQFLKTHSLGTYGGLASYRPGDKISAAMTAEALFCKQMLDMNANASEHKEAVDYLIANIPRRSQLNLYYWYYGTLAMRNHGGPQWNEWNVQVRELLLQEQRKDGALAGSWDPTDPWGPYGGRIYSTTLSTLTLEVYYRFLPLYNLGLRDRPE